MSEPRPHGASPPETAAAVPPPEPPGTRLGIPRVVGRPVGRVLGRRAHRELVGVRLADQRQARRPAAGGDGRVEDRHVAGEDLRAGGRLDALRRDHVLERDRDAGAAVVLDEPEIRVELVVALACCGRVGARAARRTRPRARSSRPSASSAVSRSVSITPSPRGRAVGGTRKRSPSRAGAFANASSSGSEGRGSSSSQTLTRSSGCEVGGTSARSSSATLETASRMAPSSSVSRSTSSGAQVEAREPRDVQHRVPVDRHPAPSCQSRKRRAPPGARRTKLESGKPKLP